MKNKIVSRKIFAIACMIFLLTGLFTFTAKATVVFYSDFEDAGFPEWDTANNGVQSSLYFANGSHSMTYDGTGEFGFDKAIGGSYKTINARIYLLCTSFSTEAIFYLATGGAEAIEFGFRLNGSDYTFYLYSEIFNVNNGTTPLISEHWYCVELHGEISTTANITLYLDGNIEANLTGNNDQAEPFSNVVFLFEAMGLYHDLFEVNTEYIGCLTYMERVVNGGFETGDFTGWTNEGETDVNDTEKHSGIYSARFHQYPSGAKISQQFTSPIPKATIHSFTLFHKEEDAFPLHASFTITLTYDDETTTEMPCNSLDWGYDEQWHEFNILSLIPDGKNLTKIQIEQWTATFLYGYIDDVSLTTFPVPFSFECRVTSSPEINADWELDSVSDYTPWNENITEGSRTLEAMEIIATRDAGQNRYRFANWTVTNSTGSYNFTTASITLDIQEEHNFTINYFSYTVMVASSPEINTGFTASGYTFSTPKTLQRDNNTHTFVCTDFEISVNSSYKYTFDHWSINGTGYYGSLSIDVEIGGDTNLTMHYLGSWIYSPDPIFAHGSINGTWYFRSDTHTIHEILAYRLDIVNTYTSTYDSRSIAGSYNISYGIRVWIIDMGAKIHELSGGTPEAIVTRTSDGEGFQSAYFNCPAYAGVIDAVQINLYQRFNSEPWSLRRYFITDEDLYIKLPASSWTIQYFTNRTTASTTAYFYHGSTTFNSLILFQYYRANPWELALARLVGQNYLGFMTTPWTYYLGDIFWSLLLLFGIVTMYNRVGSLKPILALLWIFGGVGSVLSAMIPALVLHVAWLMLAVAMGITLFKLIYR